MTFSIFTLEEDMVQHESAYSVCGSYVPSNYCAKGSQPVKKFIYYAN